MILQERVKERKQPELKNITLYEVSSSQSTEEVITAHETCDAADLYRKRYPNSADINLTRIELETEPYWNARLVKCLLLQMKQPFVVDMDI